MPTTFGVVLLVVLVLGALVGLGVVVAQARRRREDTPRPVGREAPYGAEAAAAQQARHIGGQHPPVG